MNRHQIALALVLLFIATPCAGVKSLYKLGTPVPFAEDSCTGKSCLPKVKKSALSFPTANLLKKYNDNDLLCIRVKVDYHNTVEVNTQALRKFLQIKQQLNIMHAFIKDIKKISAEYHGINFNPGANDYCIP